MSIRSRSRALAALLVPALAACDATLGVAPTGGEPPAVAVTADVVAPGTPIEFRVTNTDTVPWGYPVPCNASLERQQGGSWVTAWDGRALACTQVVYVVAPGVTQLRTIPGPDVEGTYRVRLHWDGTGGAGSSASAPFEVRGDGDVRVFAMVDAVPVGGTLPVRVVNTTTFTWGYNTCAGGRFQRLVNGQWTALGEPFALCSAQLDQLAAAGVADLAVPVPAEYAAGTYRFTQRFARDGAAVVSASAAFRVE